MDESGNPTGETTWAVYSSFAINPDLLKRGESNTVVVRAWNDLPFGGGGWYSGPVALYSQSAFEKEEDGQSRFFEEEFESASMIRKHSSISHRFLLIRMISSTLTSSRFVHTA